MRAGFLLPIPLVLSLAACSSADRAKSQAPAPPPQPCVRILNSPSNLIQLQIAVREFVPVRGKGPAVWLTGVSHIGDSNYYAALQKHLDAQQLVLYEGVSASTNRPVDGNGEESGPPRPAGHGNRSALQSAMAESLGLVFQLDAIDYHRPNFRSSDLSIPEIRKIFDELPPSKNGENAGQGFESLLQIMQGGTFFEALLQMGLRVIGSSPELQGLAKLALIDTLGQINGDPARLQGLSPGLKQLLDVLVARRNEKVIADLKAELSKRGAQGPIAIFYGTGHMPDLESRLRNELHYRPATELWFTAFSVNLTDAGISPGERAFVHNLVQRQLEQAGSR